MPNALTHFWQTCDWHETTQTLQADTYSHCPRCRSSKLNQRPATRLELIAAMIPTHAPQQAPPRPLRAQLIRQEEIIRTWTRQ